MRSLGDTHVRVVYEEGKAVPSTLFYYDMERKWMTWLGRDEYVELWTGEHSG
jgi:hypothetical protein